MASTARLAVRASRSAAAAAPAAFAHRTPMIQRAAFSRAAARPKSEVIKETEVPVSVYSPDSKGAASANSDHFSIPVRQTSNKTQEIPAEKETISPLSPKLFSQLPATMQKMTVMGKVIVVTG